MPVSFLPQCHSVWQNQLHQHPSNCSHTPLSLQTCVGNYKILSCFTAPYPQHLFPSFLNWPPVLHWSFWNFTFQGAIFTWNHSSQISLGKTIIFVSSSIQYANIRFKWHHLWYKKLQEENCNMHQWDNGDQSVKPVLFQHKAHSFLLKLKKDCWADRKKVHPVSSCQSGQLASWITRSARGQKKQAYLTI